VKALWIAVIAVAVASAMLGAHSTSAALQDTVTAKNITFTGSALAPPTSLTPTLGADGETVTLTWTATASTFATGYDLYRGATAGTYPTFVANINGRTTVSTTDVPPSGTAAHYAMVSRYQGWSSAFSAPDVMVLPLDHFAVRAGDGVSNIPDQTTGVAFTVKVIAQAFDNSTVSALGGNVTLSSNAGAITCSPSCTQPAVSGIATFNVTYAAPVTGTSLTALGGSPNVKTGTSNLFNVIAAGPPPIANLNFDSAAGGTTKCSATRNLTAGAVSGSVTVDSGTSVTWVDTTDGLSSLPAGSYAVTLNRLANSPNNTSAASFTVEIGVCDTATTNGTYTQKAISTGQAFSGGAQVVANIPLTVAAGATLDATHVLVVRITNTQSGSSKNNTITLATDGTSFLVAPSRMN
jgi:hypothetical protein